MQLNVSDNFITNLDWNLLRTFVVIANEGGITAAAARLLRRQPTVSAALIRLEAQIGQRLIERGGGTFRLTAAGRELYRECSVIYSSVSRLKEVAETSMRELTGNVEIWLASHVVTPVLDRVLAKFHTENPKVTYRMNVGTSERVTREVLEKTASFGICLLNKRQAKLRYEVLYREYFGFFCGQTHPLFGRNNLKTADLRDCVGVTFDTDSMDGVLRPVAQFRQSHGLEHEIVGRSLFLEEVRRMIVCGLGIGPLPIHVMAPEVENGTLWWLPPYDNPPAVDIFLVANPTKRLIRAETEFIKRLRAEIVNTSLSERTYRGLMPSLAS